MHKRHTKDGVFKLRNLLLGIIIFFLLAVVFNFYQGSLEKKKMAKRIIKLKKEIAEIKEDKKELKEQIEHINSKEFIEKVAREELGLVKEGEILYITVEK